uniref:Uncharacterized protein LOC105057058 isoform X1 n=1 Tax=Elaeis guineensis var. tenera TaxID=51953 RepID=A0A6J0PR27_ELAGV|nr:uncharacterized protein LOC105057058 isoform X1 [Elaeis guineensis]
MVVVHVQAAESEEFLYECPSSSTIDEIADSMCDIATLQSKIHTLSRLLRRRALMDDAFRESYPDVALALERTLSEAEVYASKVSPPPPPPPPLELHRSTSYKRDLYWDQVQYKRFLSPHALRAHIKSIEKEVKGSQLMSLSDLNLSQFFSGTSSVYIT